MARGSDFAKSQTFAASPAEPGELPLWFRRARRGALLAIIDDEASLPADGRRSTRFFRSLIRTIRPVVLT
jgi:hypothetical protein